MARIMGRQDRALTNVEFIGFVTSMTKELAEMAEERGMTSLAHTLWEAHRMSEDVPVKARSNQQSSAD